MRVVLKIIVVVDLVQAEDEVVDGYCWKDERGFDFAFLSLDHPAFIEDRQIHAVAYQVGSNDDLVAREDECVKSLTNEGSTRVQTQIPNDMISEIKWSQLQPD